MQEFTKEQLENLYAEHKTIAEVARILNISYGKLNKAFHDLNIEHRIYNNQKKYNFNENVFSNLDDPAVLYWAGFLLADGHITKKKYKLCLELCRKDYDHMIKFKNQFNFPQDIKLTTHCGKNDKIYFANNIQIHSLQIVNDLKIFNIVNNKSNKEIFPDILLNNKHINHFIRGYIDGDGCLSFTNNKISINIFSSKELLTSINKILVDNNIVHKSYINKTILNIPGICSLYYNDQNTCINIINWLYLNSNESIYLERKYNIIKQFIGNKTTELKPLIIPNYNKYSKQELEKLYIEFKSLAKIAKHLKIEVKTLRNQFKENNIEYELRNTKNQIKKYLFTKEQLEQTYANEKTICGVAKIFNCSRNVIRRDLKKFGIIK